MDNNIYLQFFSYCYEGEIDKAKELYFNNHEYINIRKNNDKIFKFCCQASIDMCEYNDKFNEQSKNILKVIIFLCELCNYYKIEIQNNKLINWNIEKHIIIFL